MRSIIIHAIYGMLESYLNWTSNILAVSQLKALLWSVDCIRPTRPFDEGHEGIQQWDFINSTRYIAHWTTGYLNFSPKRSNPVIALWVNYMFRPLTRRLTLGWWFCVACKWCCKCPRLLIGKGFPIPDLVYGNCFIYYSVFKNTLSLKLDHRNGRCDEEWFHVSPAEPHTYYIWLTLC